MIQIRLVDHEEMKKTAAHVAAVPVELQTLVTAQRLAFQSLPATEQLHFLQQAATADSAAVVS